MISLGSRDARKGLELSFTGGCGRKMDVIELEEGEACSYQNNEDYDGKIDPDVALSYIGEKLQDLLGPFQKYFEGDVSAENLGTKFDDYGSFLPSYQRSPVWSHPKAPLKARSYVIAQSPNNLKLEGGRGDPAVFSTLPESVRHAADSTSSTPRPAAKEPIVNDSTHQEVCKPATCAGAFTSSSASLNKKFTNISNQRTLKFRIKVGTDNLSTKKNATIYSGLGPDVSQSSSLDDSPSDSEGIHCEPQDDPFESPTSILQIMTSFPMLLSPLPDDLIHLTEEALVEDSICESVSRDNLESSGMSMHGSSFVRATRRVSRVKKLECQEKEKYEDAWHHINFTFKESDLDALNSEELVSKTLRLPLLCHPPSNDGDSEEDVVDLPCDALREDSKVMTWEKVKLDRKQKEQAEPTSAEVNGFVEKAKGDREQQEYKENCSLDEISVYKVKNNGHGEQNCESVVAECNVSKRNKASNAEIMDLSKKSCQQNGKILPVTKDAYPGGKKKMYHRTSVTERQKEISTIGTSLVPKSKKSSKMDGYASKTDTKDVKFQKDHQNAKDRYKEFFGDLEIDDDRMDSPGPPVEDKLMNSDSVQKSASLINTGAIKDTLGAKKLDKKSRSVLNPKTAETVVRCTDIDPVKASPKDNWVQCDKCQKWRLLPLGTDPDDLPEKWLCSMLNWLPEMNRCSISEDVTNKAVVVLYNIPVPESQNNLQSITGNADVATTESIVLLSDQYLQNQRPHVNPAEKKKLGKGPSNFTIKDGSTNFSNSTMKNKQSLVKSNSLNDVKSSSVKEYDDELQKKSSNFSLEKHKSDTKKLKMKSKRDRERDWSRATKKCKTEGTLLTGGERIKVFGGSNRKIDHSSGSGLPTTSGKDRCSHIYHSSLKDSTYDTKIKEQISVQKPTSGIENCDIRDKMKKRNLEEYRDVHNCLGSLHGTAHHPLERMVPEKNKELSENQYRKAKKSRMTKSEVKEPSTSKGSARSGENGDCKNEKLRQDIGSTLSQQSLGGMESMKRDFASLQASTAAASSSSKVSGSLKTKASIQELKSSPVESVSSSPLRISNPDEFTSLNREHMEKYGPRDAKYDDPGITRKDRNISVAHRKSAEPFLDFQDKDFNHTSNDNSKLKNLASLDTATDHRRRLVYRGQCDHSIDKPKISNECQIEDRPEDRNNCTNRSHPRKSGKGSSSQGEDKYQSSKSKFSTERVKVTSSLNHLHDHSFAYEAKHRDSKTNLRDKVGSKCDGYDNKIMGKKDGAQQLSNEGSEREDQFNNKRCDSQEVGFDAIYKHEIVSLTSQNLIIGPDDGRSTKKFLKGKTDQVGKVFGGGKTPPLPPSAGCQNEKLSCSRPSAGSDKGNGDISLDASKIDDASKVQRKQVRKVIHQNGTQRNYLRHATPKGQRTDAHSPIRRDSSSHAANNALKEAKDLKHLADRLKNSGSILESTGLYFQASLKFLHGASLLESSHNEIAKHNDLFQSTQVYSSTAKLCEFCAYEYERSKDMAAAALAYKCMEVAYMRVVYSSHVSANKDRQELQTTFQIVPPGESPSSSASDVDNVHNSTTTEKIALSKGVSSPQIAGTHIVAVRNCPNFMRLLTFTQDVYYAMEASRKSQVAFAAANASLAETKRGNCITSIKKALDYNFQDIGGLLRLVRLAMEAISR